MCGILGEATGRHGARGGSVAALRATVCIGIAYLSSAPGAVATPHGKMRLQQVGSGFFLARKGLVMTCEHVRRVSRRFQSTHGGSILVVCPYLGNEQPVSLTHALEADVLAHRSP